MVEDSDFCEVDLFLSCALAVTAGATGVTSGFFSECFGDSVFVSVLLSSFTCSATFCSEDLSCCAGTIAGAGLLTLGFVLSAPGAEAVTSAFFSTG